jgi:hypothetical protein
MAESETERRIGGQTERRRAKRDVVATIGYRLPASCSA